MFGENALINATVSSIFCRLEEKAISAIKEEDELISVTRHAVDFLWDEENNWSVKVTVLTTSEEITRESKVRLLKDGSVTYTNFTS